MLHISFFFSFHLIVPCIFAFCFAQITNTFLCHDQILHITCKVSQIYNSLFSKITGFLPKPCTSSCVYVCMINFHAMLFCSCRLLDLWLTVVTHSLCALLDLSSLSDFLSEIIEDKSWWLVKWWGNQEKTTEKTIKQRDLTVELRR